MIELNLLTLANKKKSFNPNLFIESKFRGSDFNLIQLHDAWK